MGDPYREWMNDNVKLTLFMCREQICGLNKYFIAHENSVIVLTRHGNKNIRGFTENIRGFSPLSPPLAPPLGTTLPTLQELYSSRVSKRAGKNHSGPLKTQHIPSLNCSRLVDATELWAPERPDTETVSSLRQSISWTLDIKRGTHYYTIIYSPHILLSFQICTCQTSHIIVICIVYCF